MDIMEEYYTTVCNWYALLAWILNDKLSIPKALASMNSGTGKDGYTKADGSYRKYRNWTDEDMERVLKYRVEGIEWSAIAEIFDTSPSNICHRAMRYKRKLEEKVED